MWLKSVPIRRGRARGKIVSLETLINNLNLDSILITIMENIVFPSLFRWPCAAAWWSATSGECGFERVARPATLTGCGAYGNGARLTGMIDASLKIICYGCARFEPIAEAYPSLKNGISPSKRFSHFTSLISCKVIVGFAHRIPGAPVFSSLMAYRLPLMNLFPSPSWWKYTRSMRSRNFLSLRSRSLFSRLRTGFFVFISCQFWFRSPPPHQRAGSLAGRGYVYNQRYPCLTGHTHHAKDRLACWVVRFISFASMRPPCQSPRSRCGTYTHLVVL